MKTRVGEINITLEAISGRAQLQSELPPNLKIQQWKLNQNLREEIVKTNEADSQGKGQN